MWRRNPPNLDQTTQNAILSLKPSPPFSRMQQFMHKQETPQCYEGRGIK